MAAKRDAPRAEGRSPPDEKSARPASESTSQALAPGPAPPEGAPDSRPLVVGVGGSAGSLSPLRELLAALPDDCGMAFVVVSHQAPSGQSMLPEILGKCTGMPVQEIAEATRVEANHVYVEPRGHGVTIRDGRLSVEPVAVRGVPHLPIDLFFDALARDQGSHAAGIVLSGTGTDGTLGLAAIRAESGLALVQDPATAEFDGMPLSAIHARATDFVLPPALMPARLLVHRKGLAALARAVTAPGSADSEIQAVLAVMRQRGGYDFSEYKVGTLSRRIARRMHLHGIHTVAEYAHFLEQSHAEIDALWHDWLIGVTSFFREPETLAALASMLPELVVGREEGDPLRIWVPGCATGEEAYSIVIVLLEVLRQMERNLNVQVFATDLNPSAIQAARSGRYPDGIAAQVSEQRLARFFAREDGFYRVKRELRDRVVFAIHDVLRDPPFTRVDLVSCRNLLIYLKPGAQRRLLRAFHFSLNPQGLLLLGSSENAGGYQEFFSPLEGLSKLFRRNDATPAQPTLHWSGTRGASHEAAAGGHAAGTKSDLASPLRRVLAERFGPPAVLVDSRGQVQQVHGHVGPFLELPPGRVNLGIVDMAREGLRAPLGAALREAVESSGAVAARTARVQAGEGTLTVHLEVEPLREAGRAGGLFLVSFDTVHSGVHGRARKKKAIAQTRGARGRAQLEEVLRSTRDDLQGSIEELQAANEELASANEEAQSANEELQSTNEELQTAKEEAQSLNEELQTVNAELTQKLDSFERATDDLVNLMNNIEVATIFLDDRLRVKRFTPQARSVAHLIDADIGRPLADLATLLDYPDLLADAARVIESLHASEKQAAAPDGRWYLVRIRPYRTARNTVEGVVVTFLDITDAKRNERAQAARALAESIVDAMREPFLVLDGELRVVRANRAYHRAFGVDGEAIEGRLVADLGTHQWAIPTLRERLEKALGSCTGFDDFEVEVELPHLGRRRLVLTARPLTPRSGTAADLVLLGIQEPTGSGCAGERP